MPNARRYQAGFLKRSLSFAVPAGLIIALAVLSINTYSRLAAQGTGPAVRTGSVLVLTLVALWVLVVLSRPLNRWRVLIIGVMYAALLFLLAVPPIRDFFDFTMPGQEHLTMAALIALIGCLAIELLYRAHRRHLNTNPASTT
jgi:cation-transporting ATPase E